MILLRLIRLAMVALLGLGLAGCGRSESYRYKLTLAVNTPDGVKRGSSVTEWDFWEVSIPARGTPHRLRGEALYLDLGPGKRPLIALLTSHLHEKPHQGVIWDWPRHNLLDRLYGRPSNDSAFMDEIARLGRMRGPRKINPDDLPDLVTFASVSDPKSVIEVGPNDLQATLGQGITWNEITFEMTDEPITKGIELKLPWINAYFQNNFRLDGTAYGSSRKLANMLSWSDFDQSGDLKRNK
jgi:hypothetical protein